MENQIFREKSLEQISSPEQMNDYLQVTNPAVWLVLVAVILLLLTLFGLLPEFLFRMRQKA